MLAMRTGHEELELTPAEASSFLKAAQNVARHHSIETTQKTLDYIAFLGVSAQVIGTRVLAVIVKEGKKRRASPTQAITPPAEVLAQVNGANQTHVNGSLGPSVPPGPADDDGYPN